ncbi:MAG: helicase-related protein [Carnobacterium sp.]|uniref:helicase-related protein n=1 Tax=Carnobacterium sp. TaxID=48221 RepID=UPI003C7616AD
MIATNLETNLRNREKIVEGLHEEMVGPKNNFEGARELSENTAESERNAYFYYWKYAGKKEEVFYGQPERQYNSGMLFPLKTSGNEVNLEDLTGEENLEEERQVAKPILEEDTESIEEQMPTSQDIYLPSSMGLTVAVEPDEEFLDIIFTCGSYEEKLINNTIQCGSKKNWQFRKSLIKTLQIDLTKKNFKQEFRLVDYIGEENKNFVLRIDALVRTVSLVSSPKGIKLVTISATNMTKVNDVRETANIMFQCQIKIAGLSEDFKPYPNASNLNAKISDEDKKFDMLYSSEKNYGFGQNCSTFWEEDLKRGVTEIRTTFLPQYEIKTMTPDIIVDGEEVEISHASLASAENSRELLTLLSPMIEGYKKWYQKLATEKVDEYYSKVFKDSLTEIEVCLIRMEKGIKILEENKQAFEIFKLTNLAMLMQMTNGKETREIINIDGSLKFNQKRQDVFEQLDYSSVSSLSRSIKKATEKSDDNSPYKKYKWRAFQISFLLMMIESIVDKTSSERELVDLIWFPTGGGKTEAYLSVAAYSILYRRAIDNEDIGTDIIMRYTLRLLTADQFQRSARLICSLDYLRRNLSGLFGSNEISLGMWVGAANTPNTIKDAKIQLNHVIKGNAAHFPISSCPWCGAEMKVDKMKVYRGFSLRNNEIHAYCPDSSCSFRDKLPIYFIDEQMYKKPPTFLIGTIDKFVQLTWKPKARTFFGINNEGNRQFTPPNLIIQDELHLIAGPLGTLSGMYECLIEELCTDRRGNIDIMPKIVCATATIKAYDEQILALFGRPKAFLFPPSGVNINDNFFSTVDKDNSGKNKPGRKYVGVHPFTQGRLQTEVQTTSVLLEQVSHLMPEEREPFWTILSFYNTLNDIGKALTLSEQDIPYHMKQYYETKNISKEKRRYLNQAGVKELTSRLDSDKVGTAIKDMKVEYTLENNKALDLVLASNIIEVGVDIDRLSLMMINGQPKTTAQYIQVSGRIGRRTNERPGLVVTEYNPNNSNDKSHFEHFIEYHQKLYSQVEESSVTPFSHFAIERGLPAIIIGYLRQAFDIREIGDAPDYQFIESKKKEIVSFLNRIITRAKLVDNTEIDFMKEKANDLMKLLTENSYEAWEYKGGKKIIKGFMVRMTSDQADVPSSVLPVMFSMRSVDAQSRLIVTSIEEVKNDYEGGWV